VNGFLHFLELLGTMAFAASGALVGLRKNMDIFGVCILGLTTAVGGGVLRDMLAGDTPYIFVKHIYASACLVGALVCGLMWRSAGDVPAMLTGAAVVFLIRALSAYFRWNLPRANGS
jgi:uncharacterized membrane protein YeiH